ncbi:MAG: hypothetical protein C6P37_15175 [Caldibacillus debilis]|uniref:Uncharacterized protein n=1 Tax=Caldibacillus debilis TaxID=301148 RepID=A0A3E0JY68_9BACI|nr:MAG: hypothetical protein C6W57_16480 [Caldibacillus debilis]REJ25132.1 MAG: hypothetical protein C6P37_15175 [Caldibacillus debilis]
MLEGIFQTFGRTDRAEHPFAFPFPCGILSNFHRSGSEGSAFPLTAGQVFRHPACPGPPERGGRSTCKF